MNMEYRIDHMLDTGGRSLSEADRQFVTLLFRELEQFQYQAPKDRALMFHPLRGYERYLIHKVTEIFPKLTSFSIGDEKHRRTVVCFKSKRKEQQMQLGLASPEKQTPRNSLKEPKTPKALAKSKTLDSPARGRRRASDPMGGRGRHGKYNTLDENALKKRERGLNLEGHVVNGDHDFPKSDAEVRRRSAREAQGPKKKHPARRSRSQPQLNDRQKPRSRRDSFDSPDNQYSDVDGFSRKSHRPYSEANTPEKRRNRVYEDDQSPPRRLENDVAASHGFDVDHSSSESDSEKETHPEPSDIDNNEIPPSYNKTTESKARNKAKRNMRRIKRTNSTRSCPPIDHSKHDYVNSEAAVKKDAEKLQNFHKESPVFPRRGKSNLSDAESRNSGTRGRPKSDGRKESGRKRKERKPSREYVNVPTEEILRPNSYDSSPFESFSAEGPEPVSTHSKETEAVVENVPLELGHEPGTPRLTSSSSNIESIMNHVDVALKSAPISTEIPLATAEALAVSTPGRSDKDIQTDLQGSAVDAMMSTYQAHLDAFGQLAPLNMQAQPGSTLPPSFRTSGNSASSLSSPASTYERLGEYMYKAMLNFQNMMIGPQGGPASFPGPTAVYAPLAQAAQPVYVPWMAPYFTDPNAPGSGAVPYSSQNSNNSDTCCHMHHHTHQPNGAPNKLPPRSHGSLKDLRKDVHRSTPNDHWQGHRYRESDRTPSSAEHSFSAHPSRSSKAADGFESDVSSEVTNPEVTVAEGGEGVMVYVRNRSTSSTGGASIGGSASSLQGPSGDNAARASPLGHDGDSVFKKTPNSIASEDSKKSSSSKRSTPKNSPKKTRKSSKSKKANGRPRAVEDSEVNGPGIASEEVILSLSNAPLATMEDEDDEIDGSASGSYTSSHSMHHEDADTESASKSLVGEDLSPLVCFDDNLEIACQDGSAED